MKKENGLGSLGVTLAHFIWMMSFMIWTYFYLALGLILSIFGPLICLVLSPLSSG